MTKQAQESARQITCVRSSGICMPNSETSSHSFRDLR